MVGKYWSCYNCSASGRAHLSTAASTVWICACKSTNGGLQKAAACSCSRPGGYGELAATPVKIYVRQSEGTTCRNLLDYSILPFCLSLRHYHEQAFKLVASTKMLMLVHKGQWSSNKYYAFITVSMSQLWNAERGNNWNTSLFSCCQVLVAGGGM